MAQRALAEPGRREAVAAAERAREVRGVGVADQAPDVADRDRALLGQQLSGRRDPPREQVLLKGVAELRVRALQLPGRGPDRAGDRDEGQRAAVVARHQDPAQQVQAAALAEGVGVHIYLSDGTHPNGTAEVGIYVFFTCG